jgi:hypothetical protein
VIQLKSIRNIAPCAESRLPVRLLPRSKFAPVSWGSFALRFGEGSDHLVPVQKPTFTQCNSNFCAGFWRMFVSFWRAGLFAPCQVAIGNSVTIFLRWNSAPSRIIFSAKCLALALGFSASLGYAASDEASFSVKLLSANDAVKNCAILTVRSWAFSCHIVSIEKPGEFGETLNVVNDTLSQTLSQYRAKPFPKGAEGVTTSAWSLTRESGMAVKRHETPAREGRYSLSYGATHRSADKEPRDNTSDSDWDTLNISQSDVISAAEYQWRNIAINVVSSGNELRKNSGDSRIINLAKGKIKNALRTFNNNFSSDMYSAGALSNQINGLQTIIADTPTNIVGGIDASLWTFWQNTVLDASVVGVTPSATTIENGLMLPLWLSIDRGPDDQPDLIVMSNDYYAFFEASQTSIKRYTDSQRANGGFVTLKYKNADVLFDGNSGIPSAHIYMINTNYLELVSHQDADMEIMDEMRPVNQDGVVVPILWMGNLTCSNRKQQGVVIA